MKSIPFCLLLLSTALCLLMHSVPNVCTAFRNPPEHRGSLHSFVSSSSLLLSVHPAVPSPPTTHEERNCCGPCRQSCVCEQDGAQCGCTLLRCLLCASSTTWGTARAACAAGSLKQQLLERRRAAGRAVLGAAARGQECFGIWKCSSGCWARKRDFETCSKWYC